MPRPQYPGSAPSGSQNAPDKPHVAYFDDALATDSWRAVLGVDGLGQGFFDVFSATAARSRTGLRVFLADTTGSSGEQGNGFEVEVASASAAGVTVTSPLITTAAAPASFAAEAGDASVKLTWDRPDPSGVILRYEYAYKEGAGAYGDWTEMEVDAATNTDFNPVFNEFSIDGLTNGTLHTFKIRAVTEAGDGAESAEATTTPAEAEEFDDPDYTADATAFTPIEKKITVNYATTTTLTQIKALIDANANLESRALNAPTLTDRIAARETTISNAHKPGDALFQITMVARAWVYCVSADEPQTDPGSAGTHDECFMGYIDKGPVEFLPTGQKLWIRRRGGNDSAGSITLWKYGA